MKYRNNKKGFIAFVTMFLLVIFALMGIAYWHSSRMNTDVLFVESQRLKARNYAQAGIETVKINICNTCQRTHKYDMSLENNYIKEYKKEFEDGGFRIISIAPFAPDGKDLRNVKHYVKGRMIGEFDVWEIISEGYIKNSSVTVRIKTIIRVFHDTVVY